MGSTNRVRHRGPVGRYRSGTVGWLELPWQFQPVRQIDFVISVFIRSELASTSLAFGAWVGRSSSLYVCSNRSRLLQQCFVLEAN